VLYVVFPTFVFHRPPVSRGLPGAPHCGLLTLLIRSLHAAAWCKSHLLFKKALFSLNISNNDRLRRYIILGISDDQASYTIAFQFGGAYFTSFLTT
jgi:hypothetical protein